ncbi:MAG: hypothetical protein QOH58_2414 [Thermoleophilaceae bacterium]|jgi:hypothetical protein|nr:hypothetical protein [Thermoleophilaceae bacterium]
MADAGLFIGWGQVVRGREERALAVFGEALQLYARLEDEGRIESHEVVLLTPHGGELAGYALLRGTEDQIDVLRHADDFMRSIQRADLIVENLGVIDAALGEGLAKQIAAFQEELAVVA